MKSVQTTLGSYLCEARAQADLSRQVFPRSTGAQVRSGSGIAVSLLPQVITVLFCLKIVCLSLSCLIRRSYPTKIMVCSIDAG